MSEGTCPRALAESDHQHVDIEGDPARRRLTSTSGPWAPRFVVLIAITLAGLVADQSSKARAFAAGRVPAGPREVLPGLWSGVRAENYGAAASLAAGSPLTAPLCALNALFVIAAAARWALARHDRIGRGEAVGGGLLLAGLLGNSGDRLALGYVRDFLVVDPLPGWIFNLADAFILAGALALLGTRAARAVGRLSLVARPLSLARNGCPTTE